ncbi:D111/G-patch domain-containing protein [Euphorbia peplus]|nr:D111/G-patch domain-containing protein [Euphorbia peplus]
MKLSFSIPSKSSHKPKSDASSLNNDAEKQFVTEFDSSRTLANPNQTIIIPPKENEWRPHKRMKNIDLRFEAATGPDNPDDGTMSYGLNLRSPDGDDDGQEGIKSVQKHGISTQNMLSEDRGFEEFEDVPVDGFGAALLAGYGWVEGRGIGKNAKRDVKVKEYHKRADKGGLGFVASASNTKNHKDRDSPKEKKIQRERRGHGGRNILGESDMKDERIRWLRNHIRVRIVSKDLKGGRFYLKKGQVVDVVGPYICDIYMDDSKELVQGVNQDLLETALPRRGGPVLVLYGKHKGAYGNLVERDLDRETGVVQDLDTHEMLNVKLEQVAEYIGDPSYVGY